MMTEKDVLSVFFKIRFQKSGFCVKDVIVYSNQIRVHVSSDAVKMCIIDEIKEVLGWSLDEIWTDTGDLVFNYK